MLNMLEFPIQYYCHLAIKASSVHKPGRCPYNNSAAVVVKQASEVAKFIT